MALALSTYRRLPLGLRRLIVRAVAPTYVVGVVAVIHNAAGELLLLRERHHEGWALPGGLLSRGEHPPDALVRELREEIGASLPIDVLGEPMVNVDPRARRVDLIFQIDDVEISPVAQQPEVFEVHWFAPDDYPELFEPTVAVLAAAEVAARADG
jgi:8-oxo-dGTP diphosphatase